ncbi:hypothetical protein ACQ86K_20305 [Mucilaginibacter sp. P19]|uniref:hypothetical protein n=1 Tax=Mucilaginibacter sp. P19 TaxID=3423947 RepID=UPI003D678B5B
MAQNTPSTLNKNLIILHFTVFVWGFTGILGALITISAVQLVWFRVLIAFSSLFLYFKFNKTDFKVDRKTLVKLVLTGAIVGGHWILFSLPSNFPQSPSPWFASHPSHFSRQFLNR